MKRGIRKSDVVLFIAIMVCAAIFYFFLSNNQTEPNARLIVKVDGEVIKTCSLEEDQVFWLPGKTNEVYPEWRSIHERGRLSRSDMRESYSNISKS